MLRLHHIGASPIHRVTARGWGHDSSITTGNTSLRRMGRMAKLRRRRTLAEILEATWVRRRAMTVCKGCSTLIFSYSYIA